MCEAQTWKLVPVADRKNRYTYTTRLFAGSFTSLTKAKEAHLTWGASRDVSSPYEILPRGSPAALTALKRAKWREVACRKPCVGSEVALLVDVVVVDASRFTDIGDIGDEHWTKRGLVKRGFLSTGRASVVLERGTMHILSMFLTGAEVATLSQLAARFPALHCDLLPNMNPIPSRPDLVMCGYRFNENQENNSYLRKNLDTGYYCVKSKQRATELWRDEGAKGRLVEVASAMCDVERSVSPAMAEHRAGHSEKSEHPGFLPGVSKKRCSAVALGISKSYVSRDHFDEGAEGMAECIVWMSKRMRKTSDYVFADVGARIVFDLVNPSGAAMCLIPGSERHGTPGLRSGCDDHHEGFGAVILNKANVASERAITSTRKLVRRLRKRKVPTNPFLGSFSVKDQLECRVCGETGAPVDIRVCGECNQGVHRSCAHLTAHPSCDDKVRYCPPCMKRVTLWTKKKKASHALP